MMKSTNRATDAVQGIGDTIKHTASTAAREHTIDPETIADQVKGMVTQAASAAESAVDQGFDRAAEAATGAADMLHRQADSLPGDKAADLARQAAGNLAQGADYLRETDVAGMRDRLAALIRRYPAPSLAVGLVLGVLILGFAIAWFVRRD
jgi:hypothetical protein